VPGFGSLFGTGNGGGVSPRQRLALLVSAATLAAAVLLVTWLSPKEAPARPPRDLLDYAQPGVLAAMRVRDAAGLWEDLARTRFWAEARAHRIPARLEALGRRLLPYVPPPVLGLAPLSRRLFALDAAVFVYTAGAEFEVAAVARAREPIVLDIPGSETELYRGFSLHAVSTAPGRPLHATWRGMAVLAASTRQRLKALVDRHLGATGPRLTDDPLYASAVGALPAADRAFAFVDLRRAFAHPTWAALARGAAARLRALAASIDVRRRGARLVLGLAHDGLPAPFATAAAHLGRARRLRAPTLAPEGSLAFAGGAIATARLRDALSKLPWLARDLPDNLAEVMGSASGEIAFGALPGRPVPSLWLAAEMNSKEAAESALAALSAGIPGPLGEALAPLTGRRERRVDGARLVVRDLPLVGAVATGARGRWVFGGGAPAVEAVAQALGENRWGPSALAREVFSSPQQVLAWVDAEAVLAALRRAAPGLPALRRILAAAGRLPEVLRDLGAALRFEEGRVVAQLFVAWRDLP
jgi:hypothetical protein